MTQNNYLKQAMTYITNSVPLKNDLKSAIAYIQELTPLNKWLEIEPYPEDDNLIKKVETYWDFLGKSLDAFFGDAPNPILNSDLPKELHSLVQKATSDQLILSIIIFESEHFIKKEAQEQGIEYPFALRSELLKQLAFEECFWRVIFALQNCYESISTAQFKERSRVERKFFKNEITNSDYEAALEKWDKENSKLLQPDLPDESQMKFWTVFCENVFRKYKSDIPSIELLANTFTSPKGKFRKGMIINGQAAESKSRGRGKANGFKSEPLRSRLSPSSPTLSTS